MSRDFIDYFESLNQKIVSIKENEFLKENQFEYVIYMEWLRHLMSFINYLDNSKSKKPFLMNEKTFNTSFQKHYYKREKVYKGIFNFVKSTKLTRTLYYMLWAETYKNPNFTENFKYEFYAIQIYRLIKDYDKKRKEEFIYFLKTFKEFSGYNINEKEKAFFDNLKKNPFQDALIWAFFGKELRKTKTFEEVKVIYEEDLKLLVKFKYVFYRDLEKLKTKLQNLYGG